MKKVTLTLVIFFITSIIVGLVGCKKDIDIDGSKNVSSGISVLEAKSWFVNGPVAFDKKIHELPNTFLPQNAPLRIFSRMTKIENKLKWEEAESYKINDIEYLIVPIVANLKKYGDNYELVKSAIFYRSSGKVIKMNIIELFSKKGTSLNGNSKEIIRIAFLNKMTHKNVGFERLNANIFFYDEVYRRIASYDFNDGTFKVSEIILKNIKKDETNIKSGSLTENLNGEDCQTWNVYLDTYLDGELISHEWIGSYDVGNCVGDDPEEEMPEGEGGGSGGEEVNNYMSDPCKNAALAAINTVGINNTISQFYNAISTSAIPVNITFLEASVPGGGPAATVPMGNNSYVIALSNDVLYNNTFMSQEAWGAIIAHEILHVFILNSPLLSLNSNQHATIFSSFINSTSSLLQSGFGMTPANATKLALNGLSDLWTLGNFSSLCTSIYGYNTTQLQDTYDEYTIGTSGIRCN